MSKKHLAGRVNRTALANLYHTTIFEDDRCHTPSERRLVAMDINTDSNGDGRYIWFQGTNKLNGGDILLGETYLDFRITDPVKMRSEAAQLMKNGNVSFTEEQLDKIFAQGGYLEPERVAAVSDKHIQTSLQQDRFKVMTPDDLHPLVLRVSEESVRAMSPRESVNSLRKKASRVKFEECMENAVSEGNNRPLIDQLLIYAEKDAESLKKEGTTDQVRFLLANYISVDEILGLADHGKKHEQMFLSLIHLDGFESWEATPGMAIVVRSHQDTEDLINALAETPIADWILGITQRPYSALPVNFELSNNINDLSDMISGRVDQFKREFLSEGNGNNGSFHFHSQTGEVFGPLYPTTPHRDAPARVDLDEYKAHYNYTIAPGDVIDILDLGYTTIDGKKEEPSHAWREEKKAMRDDDQDSRMS